MCMAEQLVTNLQVLQRQRLQVKVPTSENISYIYICDYYSSYWI